VRALKEFQRRGFRDSRVMALEDWTQEWWLSQAEAQRKGWSQDWAHITGATVRRCLSHSRPGLRTPTMPAAVWPVKPWHSVGCREPWEDAAFRQECIVLLRQAQTIHPAARRILSRIMRRETQEKIAKRYRLTGSRVCQVVSEIRRALCQGHR